MFGMCSIFLLVACILQRRLMVISDKPSKTFTLWSVAYVGDLEIRQQWDQNYLFTLSYLENYWYTFGFFAISPFWYIVHEAVLIDHWHFQQGETFLCAKDDSLFWLVWRVCFTLKRLVHMVPPLLLGPQDLSYLSYLAWHVAIWLTW